MTMKNSLTVLALAAGLGAWAALLAVAAVLPEGGTLSRLATLLGGTWSGYIQAAIYAVAVYAALVLQRRRAELKREAAALSQGLLPEQEQLVLTPEEVAGVKLEAIRRERGGNVTVVGELIKKACAQFRNANDVGETLQVFQAQVATRKEAAEGELEVVRYLTGAVVSLGFIGTLLGLSSSIGLAHLAGTDAGMSAVTASLNLAFDTTLVALVVGLVVNLAYHAYLRELDTFYSRTRGYVIDNLISRIYRPEALPRPTPAARANGFALDLT